MFELTKAQKGISKAARDFARGEFDKELAYELEKNSKFPTKIWKKAADLGFLGIHYPEKYSGGEMGLLENLLVIEEFCRRDSSIGFALSHAGFSAECILHFGSDGIKEMVLPKIAEGCAISAGAFAETDFGRIPALLQTTAACQSQEWVINGRKTFVINGGKADYYLVLCQTDSRIEPATKGQSLILVEGDRPGLSLTDSGKNIGGNMIKTAALQFENVRVPATNLVGKEGQGFDQLQRYLGDSRLLYAAQALGTAAGALDRTLEYAKGRVQFNKRIVEFQVSQHKIAEMATQIELSRLITYKAAWTRDKGKPDHKLSSMAKMTATQTATQVCAHAIQIFGGYGYMAEYEVERFYRDAKFMENRDGSDSIQKDIIASSVIGKLK
ncbi:MAG: acyl-CoA dehydrogenase [Deltaproteobacteria bacterium]|nr:acyl-CoA dehydrogenase [Deltaproteobacteria bacterium]